jgi:hypothetical protein
MPGKKPLNQQYSCQGVHLCLRLLPGGANHAKAETKYDGYIFYMRRFKKTGRSQHDPD